MIRNAAELSAVCSARRRDGLAALDTEFVWNRTYRARLGLVQIGSADGGADAVDCLLGTLPSALGELLADPDTVKVLHDAPQDLMHLVHYTKALPRNVFDTRLAAGFAGFASTLGLQHLLEETLGISLPKTETMTDWCRRPLTPEQVEYALDDVRHLAALRADLLARAKALGNAERLAEEMRRFDDPARYADDDPQDAWRRVKGAGRLRPRQRAALRELATVRERFARDWNLPRLWLTDDASLLALACDPPTPRERPRFRHRLRNNGQRDTLADRYASALRTAANLPESDLPVPPERIDGPELRDRTDRAIDFLRRRAEEAHIDSVLVASRPTLAAFLTRPEAGDNPLATGWRHELVGREIASRFAPPRLL